MNIFYLILKIYEKILSFLKQEKNYYKIVNKNVIFLNENKENIFVLEASPSDIKDIEIRYGKSVISTFNSKIKKIDSLFIPYKMSFVGFLYERSDPRENDIIIKVIMLDDKEFNRVIKKDDKEKLEGWYKEILKTIEIGK